MATYRFDSKYAIALGFALGQTDTSDTDKRLAERILECAKSYRISGGKPKVDLDLTEQEVSTVRALLPKLNILAEDIWAELKASGCKWPADAAEPNT